MLAALTIGSSAFWDAGTVEKETSFPLRVAAGGERLRVAYDTPSREDSFTLSLTAPDGTVTAVDGSNVFNAEAFVKAPAAGEWKVTVTPAGATDAAVRLRAKLEGAPAAKPDGPLLPNLRAVPPYELGFVAPANPGNAAYPPDTVNPPLSVAGVEPLSCTADEAAPVSAGGGGAVDCLRLTSGPINVGDGPFMKRFTFRSDMLGGQMENAPPYIRGQARQAILMSDGSVQERDAGTYSFHTTHAHFHDDGILTYELFRVEGPELTPAGSGTKSGFCPADQLMGDWRGFSNDVPGSFGEGDTFTGSCYGANDDGLLALTRGWGDVYRWQRPGQYVEFAGNGDGLYVLRTTVDKGNTTLETVEDDNSAYALVRVVGRTTRIEERGWGESHRDPEKVIFTGFGPASQDPFGADVPDTTAPRITRVRLKRRVLRFTLSEAATVRIGKRTLTLPAGRAKVRVRARRVVIVATDAAGNVGRARVARRR